MRRTIRVCLGLAGVSVIVFGLVLYLARGSIVRSATIRLLEEVTGFGVELGDVDVRLLDRAVEFKDARLLNPEPFTESEAVHVARLYAELTWPALLGQRTWLRRLDILISSLTLVRPREGLSNFERLAENAAAWELSRRGMDELHSPTHSSRPAQQVSAGFGGGLPLNMPAGGGNDATPEIQIDQLRVHLGRITVIDYKLGRREPVTFAHDVNEEKAYTDVTNLEALSMDLAIDFAIHALFGGGSEWDKWFPGLSGELKEILKKANAPVQSADGHMEDGVDLIKQALKEFLK